MSLPRAIDVPAEAQGQRLDVFLAAQLDGVSRSRVQLLIDQGDVLVDGEPEKPSLKLRGGEQITITGEPHPAPLKAVPEAIPLDVVYEDADLAVVNKPAGMMVHAERGESGAAAGQEGAAANELDARSRGTLVNALLHRFKTLSSTAGELAPRHCAPARQEHQRTDRRGQERSRSCGPGRHVCGPARRKNLSSRWCTVRWRARKAPSAPRSAAIACAARA